jgi:hypothetical protein
MKSSKFQAHRCIIYPDLFPTPLSVPNIIREIITYCLMMGKTGFHNDVKPLKLNFLHFNSYGFVLREVRNEYQNYKEMFLVQ